MLIWGSQRLPLSLCGGVGGVGWGVCTVIFVSNPTTVLRLCFWLCCVVVWGLTIIANVSSSENPLSPLKILLDFLLSKLVQNFPFKTPSSDIACKHSLFSQISAHQINLLLECCPLFFSVSIPVNTVKYFQEKGICNAAKENPQKTNFAWGGTGGGARLGGGRGAHHAPLCSVFREEGERETEQNSLGRGWGRGDG